MKKIHETEHKNNWGTYDTDITYINALHQLNMKRKEEVNIRKVTLF